MSPRDNERSPLELAVAESAVVLSPQWGTLRVSGADRATWLNGVVTCGVTAVSRERGAWGFLLTKQGKVDAELHVASSGDELWVATPEGAAEAVATTLDRYLVMEDAELANASSEVAWLALHGPRAFELGRSWEGALAAVRLDWTPAGGALMAVSRAALPACLDALRARGAYVATESEWEPARIRLGLPRFGVDYDGSDNPHEAGLERRAIDWGKGCYLGQEVVCMQDMRGKVKRRLVRLVWADHDAPQVGAALHVESADGAAEGAPVGAVKSVSGAFAIASVRAPSYDAGTVLLADGARVTVLPLSE